MVAVLDQAFAVTRNCHCHELANDAAEVSGHQETFQSRERLRVQLLVDKAEEVNKIQHSGVNVRGGQPVWKQAARVESCRINLHREGKQACSSVYSCITEY